jgi:hypothetical protein
MPMTTGKREFVPPAARHSARDSRCLSAYQHRAGAAADALRRLQARVLQVNLRRRLWLGGTSFCPVSGWPQSCRRTLVLTARLTYRRHPNPQPFTLTLTLTHLQAQRTRKEWGVCSFLFEPNRVHSRRLIDLQTSYRRQVQPPSIRLSQETPHRPLADLLDRVSRTPDLAFNSPDPCALPVRAGG